MLIPEQLLEIVQYEGDGYRPVVDYASWRVAILNYIDELRPENITSISKHAETDEVFVLLAGKCLLFVAEGDAEEKCLYAADMQPAQVYNVKKGVWHTHVLSRDAKVLIVENADTTAKNSPQAELSPKNRAEILALTQKFWG